MMDTLQLLKSSSARYLTLAFLFALLVLPVQLYSQGNYDCDYGYGQITISSPSAGQTYTRGNTMTISWRVGYPDNYGEQQYFIIYYSTDGGANWTILQDKVNKYTTQVQWTIPTTVTPSTRWQIRIREVPDESWWWCRLNYDGITGDFTMLKGCFAPTFSVQPTSRTICAGTATSFSVATDAEGPTYQWFLNGVAIQGATSQTYTIPNAQAVHAGGYSCQVRDQCGASGVSAVATLVVNETPSIIQQPPSLIAACENAEIRMMVRATGAGRQFQWRLNGVNIAANARDSIYVIGNATLASNGVYDCVVTGTCAPAATSQQCTVSVVARPRITTEPADATFCPGTNGSVSVVAAGSALTYQWLRNGQEIPGANSPSLDFTNYQSTLDNVYQVRVTTGVPNPNNCQTTVFSREVRVSSYKNPIVTVQPEATVDICVGKPFTLTSDATGQELTYQWFKDTVAIPGAMQSSYEVTRGTPANSGSYTVRVTGRCGLTATSRPSVVSVLTTPVVSQQPQSQNLNVGQRLVLSFTASDVREIQWTKNNQPIPGATSNTLEIASVTLQDAGSYNAIIRNSCGGAVTNYAIIRIKDPSLDLPELTLSQNTLDFGEIPFGYDRSQTVSGLIQNTGAAPLTVQSVSITGAGFTIANAPATPFTLAPSETADVSITARPGTLGASGGMLTVTSNAPAPTASMAVAATGVLRYSVPQTMAFEDTEVGQTKQLCVKIANTSANAITIDNATITGANGGEFSVDLSASVSIPAGEEVEACVTFAPTVFGAKVAVLNLNSANGGNTTIDITGSATTTSVEDQLALYGAAVYPNPSSGDLFIRLAAASGATTVEVRDMSGRLVSSFNGNETIFRWNGRDAAGAPVPSGMYMVNIRNTSGMTTLPFSIVR